MRTSTRWKLIGIASLSTLASLSGSAFADLLYDCSLVGNPSYNALDSLNLNITAPLTRDDMESAMTDLKAYCCQIGVVTDKCESVAQSRTNPESPYIFDQLVSRGFFKLDNKIDGSKDAKADAWFMKVKERTDSGKGKVPVSIQNTFVDVRQPAKWYQPNLTEDTCEIKNYDDLDLAARYTAVCMQSACITRKFFLASSDLNSRYNQSACESMARKRIEDEMTYIQTLMVRKTNTLMDDVRSTYTKSYLLETRW